MTQEMLFGTDRFDGLVEKLWQTPGWKADPVRDRSLITQLSREFPELDLLNELGKFQTWLIGRGNERMVNGRGRYQRVRNWCANARQFNRHGRLEGRRAGGSGSTAGGAPSAQAAEGARLVDW